MLKKIILILVTVSALFADTFNLNNPMNFNGQVNSSVQDYKSTQQKEKLSYKELIAFLKASNDKNKIMILGILYSTDSNTEDDYGEQIKADPVLSKKYLLKSYNMGNKKALAILAGLIFYNDNMAKLDPKLIDTENYLITAVQEGVNEAEIILGNVQLIKGKYNEGIRTLINASNKGDSSAQLQLALTFQKGIYSEKEQKMVITPDFPVAEYYLNLACNNSKKSDQVRDFCYSNSIEIINKN